MLRMKEVKGKKVHQKERKETVKELHNDYRENDLFLFSNLFAEHMRDYIREMIDWPGS
jgi:hypothetical protein